MCAVSFFISAYNIYIRNDHTMDLYFRFLLAKKQKNYRPNIVAILYIRLLSREEPKFSPCLSLLSCLQIFQNSGVGCMELYHAYEMCHIYVSDFSTNNSFHVTLLIFIYAIQYVFILILLKYISSKSCGILRLNLNFFLYVVFFMLPIPKVALQSSYITTPKYKTTTLD